MARPPYPSLKDLQARFGATNVQALPGVTYAVAYTTDDRRTLATEYAKLYGGKQDTSSTWGGKAVLFQGGQRRLSFKPLAVKRAQPGVSVVDGEILLAQFKPSHIAGLCNTWHTPEAMLGLVLSTIRSPRWPGTARQSYLKFVTDVTLDQRLTYTMTVLPPDLSSELFEILLAVKLARLLANNDPRIKTILGITPRGTTRTIDKADVQIYIPAQANFPLVDFFVSYGPGVTNAPPDRAHPRGNCLISVKAKKGGPASATSNTVKFHDMFESVQAVDTYAQKDTKKLQRRQVACAKAEVGSVKGTATLWPLAAAGMLAKIPEAQAGLRADWATEMAGTNPPPLADFLKVVSTRLVSGTQIHPEAILHRRDQHFGGKKLICGLTPAEVLTLKQAITAVYAKSSQTSNFQYTIQLVSLVCEKLVQRFSQHDSASKVNFYQMFYDRVLVEQQVAYAVAKIHATKTTAEITFSYYAAQNFDQYMTWIGLRSKNAVTQQSDALALAV
jgi:hypothetical protein